MRPPKQKQPQVKKGLCRVLEHVDVDVDEPIHIPSIFSRLIFRQDILSKISNTLKSVESEILSDKVTVVSAANCRSSVSSLPMTIPLI